ncbi:MAG: M42 family metallopeptidase [Planctomycetes bacterium]|nr:M42 family metallopeptidase [Planctomycetota bacterium]
MRPESYTFLKNLVEAPSPSGFEQPAQRIVRKRMKAFADSVETDVHGNVICTLNPTGKPRVMLAGHCDQIGLMVKHVDENGFLFVRPIGGIDPSVLPGTRVTVLGKDGPIRGVIGRKPVHLLKTEERGAKSELREMWVDIGAKNKKDALRHVSIGDPLVFRLGMEELSNNICVSPGFDNKTGTFVVMEALRLASRMKIKCALFAVSTVQEEIGLRGAATSCYGINPLVGIAVDVTHATDYPDIDKRTNGDIRINAGAVIAVGANINPKVAELLQSTAKKKRIPHQIDAEPGATGTDANVLQISRAGVAAGLVSIPNRYMHTQVEVVSLSDLDACAKVLAETIARITSRTDFVPR